MARSPENTIRAAAQAYVNGQPDDLGTQLHGGVRVHGSHRNDRWEAVDSALEGLANELGRHAARAVQTRPAGSLVEAALNPDLVVPDDQRSDGMAWWTARGSLVIDDTQIPDASWTVVMKSFDLPEDEGGPWQIVHSHFSIHHVPDGRHAPVEQEAS